MIDQSLTVSQSKRVADKQPLDARYRFNTLEEALAEAYNGAFFYIVSLAEWYKFKSNGAGGFTAVADSAIDASQFALKTDLNGLATSVLASESVDGLMSKSNFIKLRKINEDNITKVAASATNGNLRINDAEVTVYARPNISTDRPVTDTEKATWNGKADAVHVHSNYSLTTHNHNTEYAAINHEHQVWDAVLGRFREKYVLANSQGGGGDATSLSGLALNNNATGDVGNDAIWSANKIISTVNAKVNELATGIAWKFSVNTYADIATTYPNPVDGWTTITKDDDKTWRFNGTEWIDIGSPIIPLATSEVDGKMSAADKAKLDAIAEGANNYTHPVSHLASMITEEVDKRFMTDAERAKLSGVAVNATNTPLSSVAPSALGVPAVGVSSSAARADHVHAIPDPATQSTNGLMSATDKAKLNGIAPNATNTPLSSVAPSALGTPAVGVSSSAARADHVHAMPTAANIGLGNVTNESKATMFTNPVFTGSATLTDALIVGGGNELWTQSTVDATATLVINHRGYAAGVTQFRNVDIRNGKGESFAFFDGVNKRVGFGTFDPKRQVVIRKDVNNGVGGSLMIINSTYNNNAGAETEIIMNHYTGDGTPYRFAKIHTVGDVNDGTVDRLSFGIGNSPRAYEDILTITQYGTVAIGTTNSGTYKLKVVGTIGCTAAMYATDFIIL